MPRKTASSDPPTPFRMPGKPVADGCSIPFSHRKNLKNPNAMVWYFNRQGREVVSINARLEDLATIDAFCNL
jgi:hypothetical protein